jgi:hypothetical protein
MTDMTCARCGGVFPAQQIDFLPDGAVCRDCIRKADSDPAQIDRLERELLHSIGRRQLIIGIFMLVVGIAILAVGASAGGTIMLIPTGMLFGGLYEIIRGVTNLSSGSTRRR